MPNNHYKTKNGYVQAPFTTLYQEKDVETANSSYIQDLLDDCFQIAEMIPGEVIPDEAADRVRFHGLSFVISGCWLFKVKVFKSYKKSHKNYKDWCREIVGKSYHTVERIIKASHIVLELIHFGFSELPSSISQCMVLHDLSEDEQDLYQNWKLVNEQLEPHEITADSIRTLLVGKSPKTNTTIKLPIKLYEKMARTAFDLGCTMVNLVKSIYYEVYEKVEILTPLYDFDPTEGLQENDGVP